ncbi:GTPase IMAP family member 8-like protein [Labeo rohita]|uniref:GTPase IMAP family member 8-like protein n=1 Tax=Labeo rohita TaxID=84645 RepID=A0A498M994_LABRO|nr:GTPase IMAP family member 8-like protein [Labeo rohita]
MDSDLNENQLAMIKEQLASRCSAGLSAVLLTVPLLKPVQNEEEILGNIEVFFGPEVQKYIMILFTHGDELEDLDKAIDEHLKHTDHTDLQRLVTECGGKFHCFNNKKKVEGQVEKLLQKTEGMKKENRGNFLMEQMQRHDSMDVLNLSCDSDDLRIVLLGVSGAGKSSIGNAILGREAFKESRTRESEIQRGRVGDRNISIIDTPGFFNTHLTDEELQEQMMKILDLCDPGPDVFLLVINLETFEEDERNIVEKIEEIFSVRALKITMVLFTGRELMSKKEWKNLKFGEKFEDLVSKCRAYHEISRNDESNQICIKNLLNKIEEFIKQNDEQHFKSKVDPVSRTRKTKEKKKQEENSRIKEQENGRQEQTMLETFEINSTMEEGATLFEPEELQLRKTTTDICEDTVLQGMISLYGLSHERIGEENEVKTQENHWKIRQKKEQTTEEKHLTQADENF